MHKLNNGGCGAPAILQGYTPARHYYLLIKNIKYFLESRFPRSTEKPDQKGCGYRAYNLHSRIFKFSHQNSSCSAEMLHNVQPKSAYQNPFEQSILKSHEKYPSPTWQGLYLIRESKFPDQSLTGSQFP